MILQELQYAVRGLRRTPAFTLAVILTLALGIGANTALFSILNGLMLKTLPVQQPERLVLVDHGSWTNPVWEQIRSREDQIFDGAFAWSNEAFNLSPRGQSDVVEGIYASGRMFELFGVQAVRGRTFTMADDVRGGGPDGPVAVIGDRLWHTRFGGAEDVVGRAVTIDGIPFTIIGVTPPGFFGPEVGRVANVFIPLGTAGLVHGGDNFLDGRSTWWLEMMARLKPGQTIEQATAILRSAQPQIRQAALPERNRGFLEEPFELVPAVSGRSTLRTRYAQPLTIVMVVVGAVLLIACANIANLFLARASARRRELIVRLALGASRMALARQLLMESLMLSIAGAALGLLVASVGSALLVSQLASTGNAVFVDTSLDWRVLAFAMAVAVSTALFFGLAPALGVGRYSAMEALAEQSRSVMGDRRFGLRNGLVVIQVALSLMLIVAAALFIRTFSSLMTIPLGFDAESLVALQVDVRRTSTPEAGRAELFERFRSAAASVSGVQSAALSVITPLSGSGWNTAINVAGRPELSRQERMSWINGVTPGWFSTYGLRTIAGRTFTAADRTGASQVAIVNEAFARHFFGETNVVGRSFRTLEPSGPSPGAWEVVGVVSDAVYRRSREGSVPTLYWPMAQLDEVVSAATLTMRVPAHLRGAATRNIVEALGRVDPAASLTLQSFDGYIRESLARERLIALLSGSFGSLALLLAAVGLYGVTSYSVNRRHTEIGVRMALGAAPQQIQQMVLGRVGWLVGSGVVIGAAVSWWASRFIAPSLLFGLEARDSSTLVMAATILSTVGLVSGWLPARRASRLNPNVALRAE